MQYREPIDLDFGQYLLILKRRWLITLCILIFTACLVYMGGISSNKPSYKTVGKLLFRVNRTSYLTRVGEKEEATKELSPLVSTQNPLSTEMEVINSTPILQKIINTLNLKNAEGKSLKPADLKEKIGIKIIGGTDVIAISYESHNPKEAAAVVNQLMSFYIENDIDTNQAEATSARVFIAKQLPQTEATVQKQEAVLRMFKEKNNIVALTDEATAAVKVIADLDTQINTAQAELEKANARSNALNSKVGLNSQEAIAVSSLSQSTAVQGVLAELQGIEKQLATQRSRFQDQNPIIINLESKKTELTTLLQKQIEQVLGTQTQVPEKLLQIGELKQNLIKEFLESEVQRLSIAREIASLNKSRSDYQKRANTIPQLEQSQQDLERKLKAAQLTYETLLKKVQEAQLAENKNTSNARIIEPAPVPEIQVSGSKAKVLVLAIMLGFLVSTIAVFVLELSDRSLKTIKEVRDKFGYPLLGVIPSFRQKKIFIRQSIKSFSLKIPVRDTPYSQVSEQCQMLQANLKFINSAKKLKIIVVTSSVPQEGKSTISANLAAASAQVGHRVLLIDADIRNPSQHHIWGLTNSKGLSDLIVNQAELLTATCEVMNNLDVMTAGVATANPLAIFNSKSMVSLLEDFSNKYDFVIIDAPTLLLYADTLTLSQLSDGILLVARLGVVASPNVNATKDILDRSCQNMVGLVINDVSEKHSSMFIQKNAPIKKQMLKGLRNK